MSDDEEIEFGDAVVTQLEPPVFAADLDAAFGEEEPIEDLVEDDLDLDHDHAHGPFADPRVEQLETAVKTLAAQQAAHEQQRVRRKVTAATGGAGLASLVPIGLQLLGALNVTAEVASTVAAVAAAAGALLAGYLTPERAAPKSPGELLTP
jgi:hypothetical protein